jgi:hypothetical protein
MRFLSDNNAKKVCWLVAYSKFSRTLFLSLSHAGAELADFYEQIPIIIRELIYRLNDDDPSVLTATNETFTALTKYVPAEELVTHVEFMRNLIASMVSDARFRKGGVGRDGEFLLPGLNIPKGATRLVLPRFYRNEDTTITS